MKLAYRAYDANGKVISGILDGVSEADATAKLRQQGLYPFETRQDRGVGTSTSWLNAEIGRSKPSLAERAKFARALAALLTAGIPLDKALKLLSDTGHGRRVSTLARDAAESVAAGHSLSWILAKPEAGFAKDEIGLIIAAEQTGKMAPVLEDLSAMLEKRVELRARLTSALVYPIVLMVMAMASLFVIMTVLVPNLTPLFTQSGAELPFIVGLLVSANELLREDGLLLLALAIAVALAVFAASRNKGVRERIDRLKLRGKTFRQLEAARIFRTLGTLLRNGVPLQKAIGTTSEAVKSGWVSEQLRGAVESVTSGRRLSQALEEVGIVDQTSRQMISIGEETNKVETILLHLAAAYESEAGRRLERLMTLLTPLLTIGLGMLIGGLIMSVMRAILSVNDLALS